MSAPEITIGANEQKALTVIKAGTSIEVWDQISLTAANDILRDVKALRCKFDDEFQPGIDQAHAHHKFLVAQKKKFTDPLDEAERIIKPRITAYLVEQDNARREAERAAELARLKVKRTAEDASDIATQLIKDGNTAEADEIIDLAYEKIRDINADTPFVPDKPIANGTTLTKRWTWDKDSVDIEVMANDEHARKFLKVDDAKVTKYAQNMKWDAKIAGIRIYQTNDITTRVGR